MHPCAIIESNIPKSLSIPPSYEVIILYLERHGWQHVWFTASWKLWTSHSFHW